MADEDTTPKQAPSNLGSDIFEEASTTSISDQPGMLGRNDQSASVPSATEANSSGTEVNQDDIASPDVTALSNGASSSTPDASHVVFGVPEDEQHPIEDDPSSPLIPPRYGTDAPIKVVDYRTYEPPPPPRPTWIQGMCCCFIKDYNTHYARKIRNSKYILPVLVALLVIPMSALYFGIAYVGCCPLAEFSPMWVILSGIAGICFIVVRLLTISARLRGTRFCDTEDTRQTATMGLTAMLVFFMAMEMYQFYTQNPNFDNPKDPVYCEKSFYYYVFCMNFVVLVIGILGLLLHIPMKSQDPVQVVPREFFDAI